MVVCVECLPADKPWDVVSVTRRSSGVAPRACVCVYARVLVPPNFYIHIRLLRLRLAAGNDDDYDRLRRAGPISLFSTRCSKGRRTS